MDVANDEGNSNRAAQSQSLAKNTNDDNSLLASTSTITSPHLPLDECLIKPDRNTYKLEIPVLLLFFSWNLTTTVFQNQIFFQSCTNYFKYNDTFCTQLTNGIISEDLVPIEDDVTNYVTEILMAKAILENIIPAFISFFIAPWSDRYGRKPILLSTFLGYFVIYLTIALISIISSIWPISPWYYLLAFIPISILGGTCALITVIFCYITDVSTQENRAFRMARMEAAVFLGLLIGALSCSYIYNYTSTSIVFAIAAISTGSALVFIYFYVNESIQITQTTNEDWLTKFKALFEFSHVTDMFRTCFKKREGYNRAMIWLTIASLAAAIFVMEGSVTLSYQFMRLKFRWLISDYNYYASTSIVVQILGNIIGIYILSKMFGVSEIIIALIAYGSSMTEYVIVGFAAYPWQIYFGTIIALLKGVANPMCRSILANIVPPSEIGKIYSMTTSIESLSPIGSAPLYTIVFAYTSESFPGAFNFVSAAIYLICILMVLMIYVFHRRQRAFSYGSIS